MKPFFAAPLPNPEDMRTSQSRAVDETEARKLCCRTAPATHIRIELQDHLHHGSGMIIGHTQLDAERVC